MKETFIRLLISLLLSALLIISHMEYIIPTEINIGDININEITISSGVYSLVFGLWGYALILLYFAIKRDHYITSWSLWKTIGFVLGLSLTIFFFLGLVVPGLIAMVIYWYFVWKQWKK